MGGTLPLLFGTAACAGGVAVLRSAWGLPRRSAALNTLGWVAIAGGLLLLAARDGAWGIAVGAIASMLVAGALLAAAAAQPGKAKRATRDMPAASPVAGQPELALGRRTAMFLLVVPGGFAAAMLIAFAGMALARQAGWAEANVITLALYLVPLAWTAILLLLMFRAGLASALARLAGISAAAAALGWLLA